MHTHSPQTHTVHSLSGLTEQLPQLNTPHNNLFANRLGAEWRFIFRRLTIENRHSVIVCCHSPVVGLNRVPVVNMAGWSVTVTLSLETFM